MGVYFEIADYSLHQSSRVPEEISFTSHFRQWEVPSKESKIKSLIM